MSIHSSLRGVDTLVGSRSVFSREERIKLLTKSGKFAEAKSSVFGLPKVRTQFKTAKKAAKTPAADAAKPAAGAAPAAGAKAAAPAGKAAAPAAKAAAPAAKAAAKPDAKKK